MKQKNFAPSVLLILVVLVVSVAYYLGKQTSDSQPNSILQADPSGNLTNTTYPAPTQLPNPTTQPVTQAGNYKGWHTYTDPQAEFSIKYGPTDKLIDKKEGEYVHFVDFRITVYSDYTGGSRREWLSNKFDLSSYDVTYEEYPVAGVNALIVKASDPGSNGATFVVIPKGNQVYLFSKSFGQENISEVKKILATFKLL